MIKIEIKQNQVTFQSRSGVSAKTGREYKLFEQLGYAWLGGDYPELIKINLEEGQPPYPAGFYFLHPSSFRVGSYNQLQIGRIVLVPDDKKS
ncbi:single-stranded DNA-binding protein [Dickeya dadantii]|uniref:single-stranded DNA-binding protein n=1 Tax=Dickeya dadantii TaxID=204038 RepID=UPI001C0CC1E6|nr:single-stranded DNA-binding protein [Dickeya dadantii]QWT40828.1 G5P family DNA-binding protein [Dickeya dadantii]QWT40838.1 G5P family DNA-binding protein [Dickeya dadantii]